MTDAQYSISDFQKQAKKMFGTTPEAVATAFRLAGKTAATIDEAKEIVLNFLKKEVQ